MTKWTPKSLEDLEAIHDYLALNFGDSQATKTVLELIGFVENTLQTMPLAGKILESNPLFFVLFYEGNAVYYCEHPRTKDFYILYVRPKRNDMNLKRLKADF